MRFIFYVKQFCVITTVNQYRRHTHFFGKYRDTENVQFWGSQQNQTATRCQLFSKIAVKIA